MWARQSQHAVSAWTSIVTERNSHRTVLFGLYLYYKLAFGNNRSIPILWQQRVNIILNAWQLDLSWCQPWRSLGTLSSKSITCWKIINLLSLTTKLIDAKFEEWKFRLLNHIVAQSLSTEMSIVTWNEYDRDIHSTHVLHYSGGIFFII